MQCSAKSGIGVEDVLEEIVAKIPAPTGDENAPLQAVIVDSWFDNYVGVVIVDSCKKRHHQAERQSALYEHQGGNAG